MSLISFVIPAWNEEPLIGRTLDVLLASAPQMGCPFEVVVADDASTDGTAGIARAKGARVVSLNRRQIAAARNAGAKAAHGGLLIFVDADTRVTPEVLRATLQAVRGGAVGGGCTVRFEGRVPRYARLLLPVFIWFYRVAGLAAGCFLFCTREAFEAAGGFDEGLYASEECALSWALKRQGPFVLLRQSVFTSGRKLRTHSGWEILGVLLRLARRGRSSVRDRQDKEIWYAPRRPDPEPESSPD